MTPVIFCSDSFDSTIPNLMFEKEFQAAAKFGDVYLLDHVELLAGRIPRALRRIPQGDGGTIIYNGWMMTPHQYSLFHLGLLSKNWKLINDSEQYRNCHHLAYWYNLIEKFTPNSVFCTLDDLRGVTNAVRRFGSPSVILKDFVSSQKHSWNEACYIPDTTDPFAVATVVANFLRMQNDVDGVQGCVVIREFVPLRSIGEHPKSKMPISQEYRSFVLNGKVISTDEYWEFGKYHSDTPPASFIKKIVSKIKTKSNFFTVDTAQTQKGDWICIEVGDGQVSSIPETADKEKFYSKIMR